MKMFKEKIKLGRERKNYLHYIGLTLLEFVFLAFIVSLFFQSSYVFGVVGDPNATQQSLLDIGNSAPLIDLITIEDPIQLNPNATKIVWCNAVVSKFEGDTELKNASAELFDVGSGKSFGSADDNNDHYTNASCVLDTGFGDAYTAAVNCTFEVEYYANPGTWNCSVQVFDTSDFKDTKSNSTTIQTLLAIGAPDSIDYGTVNATAVSDEVAANVTNFGNVDINLSIEGYAQTEGDGYAMNCSLGATGFIDDDYEKYNLTSSVLGDLNLEQFDGNYTNVTADSVVKNISLASRTNDGAQDENYETYWRIYVPEGVAGTCEGNLIFGAIQAPGV